MVALKRVDGYLDRLWLGGSAPVPIYHDVAELWVTPEGTLYARRYWSNSEPDSFLRPFELRTTDTIGLVEGHQIDSAAPYLCWRCHTDRVQCFQSGSYETSIRCPDCETQMVVHDG